MSLWLLTGVLSAQPCAQVLLTLDNLANRNQYLNARNTFLELFQYGAVPVVNENDTVAVEELLARFGDNDTLSAQACSPFRQSCAVRGLLLACWRQQLQHGVQHARSQAH